MPKCEQCFSTFTETIEESQTKGKWRRKRECNQCHARQYSLLEEADTDEEEGRHGLECERCHQKAGKLFLGSATDQRMICIRCKCELEDQELDAKYRAMCSC